MKIIIKNARLSFADIFKAKSVRGGAPRFSATLICLDGDDRHGGEETTVRFTNTKGKAVEQGYVVMGQICDHVAKEKWGSVPAKLKNWAWNKADGTTTRDEYVNDDGDFWAGFDAETWFISASKHEERCRDGQMTVLDQNKQPIVANSGLLFSGCYVNVVLDIYAFDNDEGKGITASLEGIQLRKKGDALGITQIDAADEFEVEESDDETNDANDLM